MSLHPGYIFKGRTYKTVNGLLTALTKDAKAASIGMVASDSTITAYDARRAPCAVFSISAPTPGIAQTITRKGA